MAKIITLTQYEAPELDLYTRLSEAELYHYYEPAPGLFLAESINVILRALEAGYEPVSLVVAASVMTSVSEIIKSLPEDFPVYTAADEILSQIKGFQLTRGIQCAMKRKTLPAPSEVLSRAKRVVVLENVMNPTNVGAIIRSAAALHMDAVLLTKGCADPLQKRAIRVSVGNVFQVPWTYINEAAGEEYLSLLKEQGFVSVSMALRKDSISLTDKRLKEAPKCALLMGSEGDGLSDATIYGSDYTVMIPMAGNVDSLNVAAAAAVAFWELTKDTLSLS